MKDKTIPPELLDRFIREWNLGDDPRFNEVMTAMLRHLHELVWEVQLTEQEWLAALRFLTDTGKLCNEWRDEFQLLSDVIGLTSSMNEINHHVPSGFTDSAVMGPFYAEGSPELPAGASIIVEETASGEKALLCGRVLGEHGEPIANALLDIWQVAPGAMYAVQDESQPPSNLRGKIRSRADGTYSFITYKPVPYPVPRDGTVGILLRKGKREGMRPAHVHFIVTAEGYQRVITQLFTHDDPYMWSDAVFGEKESLLVEWERNADPVLGVEWVLDYDFRLLAATP